LQPSKIIEKKGGLVNNPLFVGPKNLAVKYNFSRFYYYFEHVEQNR